MKVLYAASEALPFIASGGLADVAGALPKALRRRQTACRVVLPLYSGISEEMRKKLKFITHFNVVLSWRNMYCGVFEANIDGVIYYLIDNEYYFKRDGIYGFYDDAERYAYFSKAVLEMLNHINWVPDIIHSNDWQTALIPVYYNLYYKYNERLQNIKNIFTIHNIQYQGKYGMEILSDVTDIPHYAKSIVDYDGCVNLMKGAITVAEAITTVSPTYSYEIMDPWYSHGLDYILRANKHKLHGILNGIDYDINNPETDKAIAANYSYEDISGKQENKKSLLDEMGLDNNVKTPVIGIVSRLVGHKGIDLIEYIFHEIIALGVKVVVLGSGDYRYEKFFSDMKEKYPENVAVTIGFIPQLAKRIYAGADMFLMPSKSEPCGLAQMIAMRYGTIPIVRETGGLADSVKDCSLGEGNGFTFKTYNAHDMLGAIKRATELFKKKRDWNNLVKYAMRCDFSWGKSAREYICLYKGLMGE